jgi:hypothetical protein
MRFLPVVTALLPACTPLNGDWSGEVTCDNYGMDAEISLEWTGSRYEGEGTLDCTDAVGYNCEETYDLQIDAEGPFGKQDLNVDIDDCEYQAGPIAGSAACENPDDVEWDGADTITGDWTDNCTFELGRE